MKRAEFRFGLLLLILVFAAGACNTKQSQTSAPPSDQTLTSDIQAKLFQDPVLKTRDINVSVQNAVVTLTGTVNSDDEKTSVERLANQESGVKQIVDQLTVAGAATAAPPQAAAPPAPEQARPAGRRHHRDEAASASGSASSAPNSTQASSPAVPASVTVRAGTTVTVRMIDGVDSSVSQPGQEFAATLAAPIVVGNQVVVPSGSNATVRLVNATSSGRFRGSAELSLELHSLTVNGSRLTVHSSPYQQSGGSRGRNTAEKVGGGAAIGGLIGAIAGGGKGAAIGAGIGAAGGGGVQALGKRGRVKVPSESKLDFVLSAPLTVPLSQ